MPIEFFVDAPRGVVFSKATGVFSAADAIRHRDRLSRDPGFRPEFKQLLDLLEVTQIKISGEEIRNLAQQTVLGPGAKRAIVVSSTNAFGLGRMFGSYREIYGAEEIRVFRNKAEALAWLQLPVEPAPESFLTSAVPARP